MGRCGRCCSGSVCLSVSECVVSIVVFSSSVRISFMWATDAWSGRTGGARVAFLSSIYRVGCCLPCTVCLWRAVSSDSVWDVCRPAHPTPTGRPAIVCVLHTYIRQSYASHPPSFMLVGASESVRVHVCVECWWREDGEGEDVWCRLLCKSRWPPTMCLSFVRSCSGCCRLVVIYACEELEKYACGRQRGRERERVRARSL
mmetsp:Transcript_19219/g.55122  ORF Transcript_19219/g.55122 Transcript_19219/m.55122 type:complete len:201 (+) Transcript_19219:2851-3453(+)